MKHFVEQETAPFRFRIAALVYDALVLVALWGITTFIAVMIRQNVVTGAILQTILFVESFVFFGYFWIHKGQTIGMVAWRLRLDSASSFNLRKALYRFCGELLSLASCGIGYMWIWIDRDRRSWSDIISSSRVVRYKRIDQLIDSADE